MSSTPKKDAKGADGKYFQTTKKGEIAEFKADLNSTNRDKVKDAVKKVIAAMTVGKDVSSLFTDVVKSMQTNDLELKKLIYLYIINYARSQPDKAILIVNTFQKDARDPSPLVRALAIRTMGCIRVDRITEYLCEPLRTALKDKDPYVRKTAAVCTAKLYDINPELVEEQDFLERLRDMISDPNPMVVANAVAALAEISEASNKDVFQINSAMLQKLLAALNECTEWGQVFLLDCLAQYQPNPKEAENIIERVVPRLSHANSAVVMSAIKIIMKYLDIVKNPALEKTVLGTKLPPPLITLLSENKPEIQYVALRNINLIVQKRPEVLRNEVKHFFCKYNDPIYVKMEKLEIMIRLAANENVEQVLMEFKEYASEVDVEFVRKAVRAIGRCAIKLEKAAERCMKVLLELIQTKVNYVVQEAIIVIKDIFRRYPNRYERVISTLCENLETLDEPEAKASMIWIIGEYAARIDNAAELLEGFVENFQEENSQVQLQLLTATVKLFLRHPEKAKELVNRLLNMAAETSDNPDLRDRAYVYWRLLATDPEAATQVVLADKPVISDDTYQLDSAVLDTLLANISTLASIYHKPPESFVKGGKTFVFKNQGDEKESDDDESEDGQGDSNDPDNEQPAEETETGTTEAAQDEGHASSDEEKDTPKSPKAHATPAPVTDLLGVFTDMPSAPPGAVIGLDDLVGSGPRPVSQAKKLVLSAAEGKGVQISSGFTRINNELRMIFTIENKTQQPLQNFAVKFNKNFYQVLPAGPIKLQNPIAPGSSAETSFPVRYEGALDTACKVNALQVAVKTDFGVVYFKDNIEPYLLFSEDGVLQGAEFIRLFKEIGDDKEVKQDFKANPNNADAIRAKLVDYNVFFVAKRFVQGKGDMLYMSAKFRGEFVLFEFTIAADTKAVAKSADAWLTKAALDCVVKLVQ
jgi:AP-1 complex subunit beta-1